MFLSHLHDGKLLFDGGYALFEFLSHLHDGKPREHEQNAFNAFLSHLHDGKHNAQGQIVTRSVSKPSTRW